MARPIRTAQAGQRAEGRGQTPSRIAASPGETVEEWLINNGQTARLREMLWEPLALAALNQSIARRGGPAVCARCWPGCSAAVRATRRWDCRCVRSTSCTPSPRAVSSRHAGETCASAAPARVHIAGGQVAHVEARGERLRAGAIVAAVPWYALPDLFSGDTAPLERLRHAAAGTAASPIASVNLWLDRAVLRTPFLGLPGRSMQWVFDKGQMFEADASHLTLVSSGADEVMAVAERGADRARAERAARGAAGGAGGQGAAGLGRPRAARHVLAGARISRRGRARARTSTGLFLAGDWIETGLPATIEGAAISGRRAAEALS